MANYTPNTWTSGDVVTKTKLDRLEAGTAAALPSADAPELIRDTIGTALVQGSGVTIAVNDASDTITISASGGGGGGAGAGVVYASNPPTGSGLTAVVADGSTDNAARIQAALNYIKTTWSGGGELILPPGVIKCNSGITIPSKVRLAGLGASTSILNFSSAGLSVTAITVNDSYINPIRSLGIEGPATGDARITGSFNGGTSTAINIKGVNLSMQDLRIRYFDTGMQFRNDDTYIHSYDRIIIGMCRLCVDLDISAYYRTGTPANNSGERMIFNNCTFYDSGSAVWMSGANLGAYFYGCSMDFCLEWGKVGDAHAFYTNCHFETTYTADTSTWGTHDRWMWDLGFNARVFFHNSQWILGARGVYSVIKPTTYPANYGQGQANFAACESYYPDSNGGARQVYSEQLIPVQAGTTTVTFYSPFISKWSYITVNPVASDYVMTSNITARVTAIDHAAAKVTVTLSAAPTELIMIAINF